MVAGGLCSSLTGCGEVDIVAIMIVFLVLFVGVVVVGEVCLLKES